MNPTFLRQLLWLTACASLIPVCGDAETFRQAWQATSGGIYQRGDSIVALAADEAGDVIVADRSVGANNGVTWDTIGMAKYDPEGHPQWIRHYEGADGAAAPNGLGIDAAGNAYVSAWAYGSTGTECTTLKYDSSGNLVWVARIPSSAAYALAVSPEGNVYVTGSGGTVKYNTQGGQEWLRAEATGRALDIDAAGNVYVAGPAGGEGPDYTTAKFTSEGQQLWRSVHTGPGRQPDIANAIRVDGTGNVIVTGIESYGTASVRYGTVKYSSQGDKLWSASYDGGGDNYPTDVAVDTGGNIYVTGRTGTVKYGPKGGTPLWHRPEPGNKVVLDRAGNPQVAGQMGALKYDSAGNQLWSVAGDFAALASDGSGNIFLGGGFSGTHLLPDSVVVKLELVPDTRLDPWTFHTGSRSQFEGIAYGQGLFVAVGNSALIQTSPDGIHWTRRQNPTSSIISLNDVIATPDGFLAVGGVVTDSGGNRGTVLASSDGLVWECRLCGDTDQYFLTDAAFGDGLYVVTRSGGVLISRDTRHWTYQNHGAEGSPWGVAYGNGLFVAVGEGGIITTSRDGIAWTQRVAKGSQDLSDIAFGGGQFVAVGPGGRVVTSRDGIRWTNRKSGTMSNLWDVTYAEGYFVVVGPFGGLLTSPDGLQWARHNAGTTRYLDAVGFGAGTFVAVGLDGAIVQSADLYQFLDLSIAPSPDPDTVNMFWPDLGGPHSLEQSTDLTTWEPATAFVNGPVNGVWSVAFPTGRTNRFFRLLKP